MWLSAHMIWKNKPMSPDLVRALMPAYMNDMDGREVKT